MNNLLKLAMFILLVSCVLQSPALSQVWEECKGSNVGSVVDVSGVGYTCVKDGGQYTWVRMQSIFNIVYLPAIILIVAVALFFLVV